MFQSLWELFTLDVHWGALLPGTHGPILDQETMLQEDKNNVSSPILLT